MTFYSKHHSLPIPKGSNRTRRKALLMVCMLLCIQPAATAQITFKAGIQWGCQLIMTAHIGTPAITGNDVPATMSSVILQDKLRHELGYQNIIIADGMDMGAITQQYTSAQAAVGRIQAGVDIVLCPKNYVEAFDAVVKAVQDGTITEERINQSVRRILKLKKSISRKKLSNV